MGIKEILKERDPTQGSITKNILSMTWPLWFNTGIWIIFYGLNIYWISKVSTEALAAVISGSTAFMLLMAPIQGIATASYKLIGGLAGNRDWPATEKMAKQILATTWLISLILAFSGYFMAPDLLKIIGAEEKVLKEATIYLRIQAVGGIISLLFWVENEIIRSAGDMMRPMITMFTVIVLNGIFDWLFILGNLGFPRLEVAGVAFASASSAAIGTVMNFLILVKGSSPIKIHLKNWKDFKINLDVLKNIFRIASFESAELLGRVVIEFIILRCVAIWGTAALAVYSIGHRLFKMVSMAGLDLGKTTAIIVANNLGAGDIKRAKKSAWTNVGFNILIMGSASLFFFIFAERVINFYSQNATVTKLGISYLKITAISYIFMAGTIILRRAFAGAGNTKTPAIITFLTWGLVQIILAIFLPKIFGLGIIGVWWAITISSILNGSILIILFKFKSRLWQKF